MCRSACAQLSSQHVNLAGLTRLQSTGQGSQGGGLLTWFAVQQARQHTKGRLRVHVLFLEDEPGKQNGSIIRSCWEREP